jgi:hypothetical protein
MTGLSNVLLEYLRNNSDWGDFLIFDNSQKKINFEKIICIK